jgi:hypothetical protein
MILAQCIFLTVTPRDIVIYLMVPNEQPLLWQILFPISRVNQAATEKKVLMRMVL